MNTRIALASTSIRIVVVACLMFLLSTCARGSSVLPQASKTAPVPATGVLVTPSPPTAATVFPTLTLTPLPTSSPSSVPLPSLAEYKSFSYSVGAIAYSPDKRYLAMGGRSVRLIEINTGEIVWAFEIPDKDAEQAGLSGERAIAFSPDGTLVVAGGFEQIIYLLDAYTGQLKDTLEHHGVISNLAFSREGQYILAGSYGENPGLTVWQFQMASSMHWPMDTYYMAVAPNRPLVTIEDNDVTLVNYETGSAEMVIPSEDGYGLAFSPDGKTLATRARDGSLELWDVTLATKLEWDAWRDYQANVYDAAWSSGNMLALLSEDGTIVVWNMDYQKPIGMAKLPGAEKLAFSLDGSLLASSSYKTSPAVVTLWAIPN